MLLTKLISGINVALAPHQHDTVNATLASTLVTSVCCDSRDVVKGSLFIAISGAARDGLNFIPQALNKGAVVVLTASTSTLEEGLLNNVIHLTTDNTRLALAHIARRFFQLNTYPISLVGVTGTNGKTTVSFLLYSVLEAAGKAPARIGTLGTAYKTQGVNRHIPSHLTTPGPLALASLLRQITDAGVDTVVMETSSHALHQYRVDCCKFDIALFLNLSRDHLDYHKSLDCYFDAKRMLAERVLKKEGIRVINLDDKWMSRLVNQNSIGFTQHNDPRARVSLKSATTSVHGMQLELIMDGQNLHLNSPLLGTFNIENILATVATAVVMGIDTKAIQLGIQNLMCVPGRLERVSSVKQPLVVVDYAHTPDALEQALLSIRALKPHRLHLVFGCGGDRDQGKRAEMGEIAGQYADTIIITNDNPRHESPLAIAESICAAVSPLHPKQTIAQTTIELDRAVAIDRAIADAEVDDTVLIAGKGHEDYQLVGDHSFPFDDRVCARKALKKYDEVRS